MMIGTVGWIVLLGYLVAIVLLIVVAGVVIRWAVLSALKAHTRWIDQGKK